MSSLVAYYFAAIAVILTSNIMIFPVKGQCTLEGCENADSSNSIVEEMHQLRVEIFGVLKKQVEGIRDLNESLKKMKSQLENAQAGSTKNQIQISWKIETELRIDFGEVPILQSPVNDWIVLMHRFNGSLNFTRGWTEYKNGFGDIGRGEFWLGNEKIYRLTNKFDYALRIEVELKTSGEWFYADYATFSLDSENNKYALHLSGFTGNAGDSLTNTSLKATATYHNGQSFSTLDNDNDKSSGNCAQYYRAGWWFDGCYNTCLTCPYDVSDFQWTRSNGLSGVLRSVRMMIKRK